MMKRIQYCFNSILAEICQNAIAIEGLTQTVLSLLPKEFSKLVQISSWHKGTLTLVASDAGCATRLRYHLPELRNRLRSEAKLYQLASIKINILMENYTHQTPPAKKSSKKISESSLAHLQKASQSLPEGPLKEALMKLAQYNGNDKKT